MTKENFFSSKPKQISEAAIIITERIFGNLENLTFVLNFAGPTTHMRH